MITFDGEPIEFDFFMDEETRSRRIGVLVMEKRLAPALTQAFFRVRQNADMFHKQRIETKKGLTVQQRSEEINMLNKQMREIKWSSLNLIRSFIAQEFIQQFFQYWSKGPLPIMFFNAPFIDDHQTSINNFFDKLDELDLGALKQRQHTQSVFFLDSFNTPAGYKFEEDIRKRNNLSRCYRLDSRVHDLIQLADLLLGLTVYELEKKHLKSRPKLDLVKRFRELRTKYAQKKKDQDWDPIYIL
ncbi:MAG: DUF3800 domain-containing protein [bacterium]|nr:DUF3800 domain-containing protein [bacterium]